MIKHLSPKTPEELIKVDEIEKQETKKFIEKQINSYKKALPKTFVVHTSGNSFKIVKEEKPYNYWIYTYDLFGQKVDRSQYKLVLKKAGNKYSAISIEKLFKPE